MTDGNNIEISQYGFHRLVSVEPELQKEYGLWIINGGTHFSEADNFDPEKERRFEFYSLSHMYKGRGKLHLNGRITDIYPGDAILICPGEWNFYGGSNGECYMEDAIRFCGRIPDMMRNCGMLNSKVVKFGTVRRLLPLINSINAEEKWAWMKNSLALQNLLVEFFISSGKETSEVHPFDAMLETIRNSPPGYWWNVEKAAELRGVSCDCLRREFLKKTGMLPKHYLEQLKLHQAAERLSTENCSISDIAEKLGYVDYYHFSRRFKKFFGISPQQYRDRSKSVTDQESVPKEAVFQE